MQQENKRTVDLQLVTVLRKAPYIQTRHDFYWGPVANFLSNEGVVVSVCCKRCQYFDESCNCCKHEDGLNRVTETSYCSYGKQKA